ncbi:MAG: radical SAM protein [Oscillospiraceae bacterium]|nr:radical SAM protein [Oscillospiraceae bacterium]
MKLQKHVLQWHITHRCNLHCTHCYQEDRAAALPFSALKALFGQYLDFCAAMQFRGHINLTGGEPLLSEHLFPLLDLLEASRTTFGILSNGTCISDETAGRLAGYECLRFVQVSIDGTRETHDSVRGAGNFDRACEGLRSLRRAGIQTMAAFTCHQRNYQELKDVIRLMRRRKVARFWADRLVPIGGSKEDILTNEQFRAVLDILKREHGRRHLFSHTDVHLNRAMQFQTGGDCIYHCAAGTTLLTLLADGTLLPCRRLPIPVGNCLEQDMLTLYRNSPLIAELRKETIPEACTACPRAHLCRGGAKCLTYAVTGKLCERDLNCWYRF